MKKILLLSLLLLTNTLFAQVPANDVCANAITLTTSTSCTYTSGTLLNATTSTAVPTCRTVYNSDVFYKFVANNTSATITVTTQAGMDPILAVYASCGGTSVGCTDVGADGASETLNLTNLTIGNTYFIQVSDYNTSLPSSFAFSICVVSTPATPPNDVCANATSITTSTSCSYISGTLSAATTSTTTPSCQSSFNSDVFYKFVANASTASISVTSATLDPIIAVYSSCGGSSVGCVDNGATGKSETLNLTGLTNGQTYYIQVADYSTSLPSNATFSICVVSTPSAPANDLCANAITLTPSNTCVPTSGTLLNATTSTAIPSCRGSYNSDVFYKFVATSAAASVTVSTQAGMDPILAVYSSCGGASVGCIDDGADGASETLNLTSLTIGNTYFIQVSDYNTSLPSSFTFSICVVNTPTNAPGNDACSNAIALSPSTACINTSGTFNGATSSGVSNGCTGYYDVFYKFVATSTATTVTAVPGSGVDVVLSVMTSCSGTTSLACSDNTSAATATETASLTGLTIGDTYYIKVQNYLSTIPSTATFSICVQNGVATSTQSSTALSAISLYPNPTQNVLNIENVSMDTKIELIDLSGRAILVQELSTDAQVDLSNYSAGVYILKLTSGGVSENRRVVLSK